MIHEQNETIREIQIRNKNEEILEFRNTIIEMNSSLEASTSILEKAEERISDLDNNIILSEEYSREKRTKSSDNERCN